jgi:isopentenyl diphosphate isomerase/L-lactate dehydrogenase-like FMN-dependent dehydrogenase
LRFLATSPLLPALDLPRDWMALLAQEPDSISAARDAINVFDFEAVARQKLPPAHFGYMAGGSDDDATIAANRAGFARYALRVRRLVDVSRIDPSVRVFGAAWDNPIMLCPVGGQRMFHPEGELAVARAARAKRHLQVLSTVGTASIEEVSAARGEPVWFQLYQRDDWALTRQMIKRAEAAGSPALVFTVDLLGGRNPETYQRAQRRDTRACGACHLPAPLVDNRRRPMLAELIAPQTPIPERGTPTWDYVKRLKDATSMKLLVKGIVTREDAALAVQHGVDGLIVSNHGGRAENSLRPTIECVPEVVAAVTGRVPVIVDSGFRRGTDIFKALALGATAVGIGRPYIWGLSAFGQEGVEAVLDILQRELRLVMRQAGTTSVSAITRAHVTEANR